MEKLAPYVLTFLGLVLLLIVILLTYSIGGINCSLGAVGIISGAILLGWASETLD